MQEPERDDVQQQVDHSQGEAEQMDNGMPEEGDLQEDQMDDQQEFEEMDLTPYEDDDDATLHKKLVAAKLARKRAEEDLKLLCNRIGLLKHEEGKANKKIDETRKRANEIITQRRRNQDHLAAKQQRRMRQEQEQQAKAAMHYQQKQQQAEATRKKKMDSVNATRGQAYETKLEKEAVKRKYEQQKAAEEAKAQQVKLMIRDQQQSAQRKREIEQVAKQDRIRAQIEEKLQREAYEQQMYEMEVQRMEKEELELINRLKDTKILEEAAHNQLETALTDPNVTAQKPGPSSAASGKRKTASKAKPSRA